MRPYVQVNTPIVAATTSTQPAAAAAVPTGATVSAIAVNDTTTTSSARPLHSVNGDDHTLVIKSYPKRSYDDAKKAFLNYSPSDNYVYSNLFVNKSKSPSFTASSTQPPHTQSLWSTHLPEPAKPKRCIDSISLTRATVEVAPRAVVLPSDYKQRFSSAEQSMLISDKNLLSTTSFDTAHESSTRSLSFIASNANSKTIDGCEVNRVKFAHCDNNNFGECRSSHVGAENVKNCDSGRAPSSMLHHSNHTINDIQNRCAKVVSPMSNSLNSSHCEQTSKCQQNSSNTEETTALLTGNDPSKLITVRKAGNASLIFTKKDSNPVVHRKKIGSHRTANTGSRTTLTPTPSVDPVDDSLSSKRHSFHWQDNSGVSSVDRKRKQVKSWYAVISSSGDTHDIASEKIEVSDKIKSFPD